MITIIEMMTQRFDFSQDYRARLIKPASQRSTWRRDTGSPRLQRISVTELKGRRY